jgi:hypothetical protein
VTVEHFPAILFIAIWHFSSLLLVCDLLVVKILCLWRTEQADQGSFQAGDIRNRLPPRHYLWLGEWGGAGAHGFGKGDGNIISEKG